MNLTDREFRAFADLVFQNSGIHIREDKRPLLQARLTKLCRRMKIGNYGDLLGQVQSPMGQEMLTELIDAVSTNVTRFFREIQHFEMLTNQWIPRFLQEAKTSRIRPQIRIWSAACSTGQEPYSLLLHLLENLPSEMAVDIQFLATDISTKVLKTAQQGIYEAHLMQDIPGSMRSRWFQRLKDGSYQIDPHLRETIKFRHFNLMEPFPFKHPWDLIFCRNVMIYFDKQTQKSLALKFHRSLKADGWLIVGLSETLNRSDAPFRFLRSSTYQKLA